MKIEINYYKISITAMLVTIISSFLILNGLTYLIFTLLFKMPFAELFSKTWIILVFVPLIQGIIQPLTNRRGMLTIKNCNDYQTTHEKVEELLIKKGFRELDKENNSTTFELISKLRKAVNFGNGNTVLTREENMISIVGQKIILKSIESKIKWDHRTKN